MEITVVFRRFDPVTKTFHTTVGKYSNIYRTVRSFFW